MKEVETAVLGDGVSALSCLLFDSSALAFTRDQGMSLRDAPHPLGPQYVHSTEQTREFYREFLDEEPKERTISFRYIYDGGVHESMDEETLRDYYEKSRGTRKIKEKDTVGSEQKVEFQILDTLPDYASKVFERVKNRVHASSEGVTKINLQERTLEFDGETYRFKKLVSTLPAPIFKDLVVDSENYNFSDDYKSTGTTFYVLDNPKIDISDEHLDSIQDCDYVYCPKNDLYRATVHKNGMTNTWTVETNIESSSSNFEEGDSIKFGEEDVMSLEGEISKKIEIPTAKTLNEIELPRLGGIFFAGRFARWSHSIKTDDVIRRLMIGSLPIARGDHNGE